MKLKINIFCAVLTVSITALFYNNCARSNFSEEAVSLSGGTGSGTGNPLTAKSAAQLVGLALCQKISACAPVSSSVSADSCYTNIQPVTNIVTLLGASTSAYPTFGALISDNLAGTIAANTAAAAATINQISALTCNSSTVQNVFNGGQANYTNVAAMIPATSSAIFSSSGAIYRSVGPSNTAALATGSTNSMSISAVGTATFSLALPNKVGVGDAVVYGNNSMIAFVSSRISATSYSLQTASGGVPAALAGDSSWNIYRAYTSFNNAFGTTGGTTNTGIPAAVRGFETWTGGQNMVTANQQWNFALYNDAAEADTNFAISTNWVSNATNYLRIYVPYALSDVGVSQRHTGAWTTSGFIYNGTVTGCNYSFSSNNLDLWLDGLQIEATNSTTCTANWWGAVTMGTNVSSRVSNNIIMVNGAASAPKPLGFAILGSPAGSTFEVWNNIVINLGVDSGVNGIGPGMYVGGSGSQYIYNNTIINFDGGFWTTGTLPVVLKNNLVQGANKNAMGSGAYTGGTGSYASTSDYNLANDGTSTGGAHDKLNQTVAFNSAAANDYRLSLTDTSARGTGQNLSADPNLSFTTDIQQLTRAGTWDIGASMAP